MTNNFYSSTLLSKSIKEDFNLKQFRKGLITIVNYSGNCALEEEINLVM